MEPNHCVTFCIAARNERNTLHLVVEAIMGSSLWRISPKREILICVNGSDDGTEEIAGALAAAHPEIQLVRTATSGKAHARNLLVRASSGDAPILFFVDADVRPAHEAFALLKRALDEDSTLVLVGAATVPVPLSETAYGFFQRWYYDVLTNPVVLRRRVDVGFVTGCCYAIRRNPALLVQLPEGPMMSDDTVLNAVFHSQKRVCYDARVHIIPPGLLDRIRVSARHRRSLTLLQRSYPELFRSLQACRPERFRMRQLADFAQLPLRVKVTALASYTAMALGDIIGRVIPADENATWPSPLSTKKAFFVMPRIKEEQTV